MKREYSQKNFGKTRVTIDKKGSICITDGWYTNWGIIYDFQIQNFKDGVKSMTIPGERIQIIGMDSQPSKTTIKWIYSKIDKGYFDHLIPEEEK